MARPARAASSAVNAIVAAAVSGLMLLAIFVLLDHFVFSGRETAAHGLLPTLIGACVVGAVLGAIVGAIVAFTHSMPLAIGVGALVFAGLKVMAIGVPGTIGILGILFSLLYGAAFGWVAAGSAAKAIHAS
jgi:hypothetical protein